MHWLLPLALALLSAPHIHATKPIHTRPAQEIIKTLNLTPNIEGGYYTETYRDTATYQNRSSSTAIYYLLEGSVGDSKWHRVDATEVWHYYAGAPLRLELSLGQTGNATVDRTVLGPDVFGNERPQVVVEKMVWQRARSLGDWTLVGTTVAPGFVEGGFEMAPVGWRPGM